MSFSDAAFYPIQKHDIFIVISGQVDFFDFFRYLLVKTPTKAKLLEDNIINW